MTDQFYLGRQYDLKNARQIEQPLDYDPVDLTTHAVITGMTGSGKTGLCIGLMEEAALQGIPAILIDPKGDLTNLLLHFPNLAPADFQPWLDADTLRRQGKTIEAAAAETAETWKNGLAEWGIDQERIQALSKAAQYSVYTPGSDAGLQISVLSSLEAPQLPWEGNKEILREKISSTVTALLGLVGVLLAGLWLGGARPAPGTSFANAPGSVQPPRPTTRMRASRTARRGPRMAAAR